MVLIWVFDLVDQLIGRDWVQVDFGREIVRIEYTQVLFYFSLRLVPKRHNAQFRILSFHHLPDH
jgi:hypothetical protein